MDVGGFSKELAASDLGVADTAVTVAWFLSKDREVVYLQDIVSFIEREGIRARPNISRLRSDLKSRRDVSIRADDRVSVMLRHHSDFEGRFARFLAQAAPAIEDTILQSELFSECRPYVQSIVRQINASYQFTLFDGCAVLMRRLIKILIIDAYETKSIRDSIIKNGEYFQLAGLIGEIASGRDFKLPRGASRTMERCKEVGDTAAHSRSYLTSRLDINDLSVSYRSLISALLELQARPNRIPVIPLPYSAAILSPSFSTRHAANLYSGIFP